MLCDIPSFLKKPTTIQNQYENCTKLNNPFVSDYRNILSFY